MLAIMVIGAVALGIVLLAFRIVVSWFSKSAAQRVDRAIRGAGKAIFQLVIVVAACGILFLFWTALRG